MSLPEIVVDDGKLGFYNGRNRAAVARDFGATTMPVAVHAGNEDEVAALLARYHIDTAENPFPILKDAIGNDAAGSRSNMLMGKMGFGAPGTAASPTAAAAPSAAGSIARKIVELPMHRAVAALDSLVRANSPLAAHVAAQLPPQIVQQLNPKTAAALAGLISLVGIEQRHQKARHQIGQYVGQ
jgi:hypothetical protein